MVEATTKKSMQAYALLGATGSTGSAVLNRLRAQNSPDLSLRLYVRSKEKLYKLHPWLESWPSTGVTEGTFDNPERLATCLQGATRIIVCIGENSNVPGSTPATEAANAIITALKSLRASGEATLRSPTVVMLSSVTVHPVFVKSLPSYVHWLLETALNHVYADVREAEARYRSQQDNEQELLSAIIAHPGGLMPSMTPTGYRLSTTDASDTVSYGDLGASMVEMAERADEFEWKGVSTVATGEVELDWRTPAFNITTGLVAHFLPSIWWMGRRRGIW